MSAPNLERQVNPIGTEICLPKAETTGAIKQ